LFLEQFSTDELNLYLDHLMDLDLSDTAA